jgi:hypothetical protein
MHTSSSKGEKTNVAHDKQGSSYIFFPTKSRYGITDIYICCSNHAKLQTTTATLLNYSDVMRKLGHKG